MNLNKKHQVPSQAVFKPHVPVRVHAPHARLLPNYWLWDTVSNMRTRTYLILWSALLVGVVLVVVLAGCSESDLVN